MGLRDRIVEILEDKYSCGAGAPGVSSVGGFSGASNSPIGYYKEGEIDEHVRSLRNRMIAGKANPTDSYSSSTIRDKFEVYKNRRK